MHFTERRLQELCEEFNIHQLFTSVKHPQPYRLVKAANKIILTGLKKKLNKAKGHWAEVLAKILWGYHTITQSTTQETPYELVYGAKAMIPIEVSQMSLKRSNFSEHQNLVIRMAKLDLIEEEHELAQ